MKSSLLRLCVVACLVTSPGLCQAAIFTFNASGTSQGNPVSATAKFTTGANQIVIEVENLQDDGGKANQAISGIEFAISGTPLSPVVLSGISTTVDLATDGSFTLGAANGYSTTRWDATSLAGGITALGGGQPDEMIIGKEIGSTYDVAGNAQTQFNPYLYQKATFTLSFGGGVSSSTSISSVVFLFGTGPDAVVSGAPPSPAPESTPEPVSMAVWSGLGILGLVGTAIRRRAA